MYGAVVGPSVSGSRVAVAIGASLVSSGITGMTGNAPPSVPNKESWSTPKSLLKMRHLSQPTRFHIS